MNLKMRKTGIFLMFIVGALLMVSCDGEDGLDGLNGADGIDGVDGIGLPPQEDTPVGVPTQVWNSFDIEDRRTNTNPGDIGIGSVRLVQDDNGYYFYEFSNFNTSDPDGTEYYVYTTVAGAPLDTQNGFANADERPVLATRLDGGGAFMITKGAERAYVPLTTPPGPAASGRMFDWIVLYPAGTTDFSSPGIVADLDAQSLLPRKQIWNGFEIQDRTATDLDPNSVTATNGYVRLITNNDQGRTRYWLHFNDFQNVGQPIVRGGGSITATSFAVFLTVAGANLNAQGGFDATERPVFVGILDTNGAQYLPLTAGDLADLDAVNGRNITFNLNNSGINLNSDGYILPQRASGGNNRWYDWVVLMPIDASGVRPISYAGFAADLDRDNDLSQNQNRSAGN
ncbi:hypothetical protein [Pseudotenacibaculum haliotis]|uniref:Uncharacterized protein n=1 Tax=Pseudotenacibaculum haliotis TaxID=1862138 RepID=A0ABW5LR13_9FLAO